MLRLALECYGYSGSSTHQYGPEPPDSFVPREGSRAYESELQIAFSSPLPRIASDNARMHLGIVATNGLVDNIKVARLGTVVSDMTAIGDRHCARLMRKRFGESPVSGDR